MSMYIVIISKKIKQHRWQIAPLNEQKIDWFPYFHKLVGLKFQGKRPDLIIIDPPESEPEIEYLQKSVYKAVKDPRQIILHHRIPNYQIDWTNPFKPIE